LTHYSTDSAESKTYNRNSANAWLTLRSW